MGKEILTFGDTEIEKKLILLQYDSHFSKGCRYWESSFYAHVKRYNGQTKWMYFLVEDLLRKCNTILDKVSTDIEFDNEPVYNEEFLKTLTKSHDGQFTGFYDKTFSKVVSSQTYLAIICLDSALKKDKTIIHKSF